METTVLTTTVGAIPHCAVFTLLNLPSVTEVKCTPPAWIRSTPAYSGTAVRLETPGTTSKSIPPRTQAAASSATALSRNGSPLTSRTTRRPAAACLMTILARAEGVNGLPASDRPSVVTSAPSATVIAGWARISACRSLSKITALASARAAMAPSVRRSGSPGPVPTKITRPREVGVGGLAEDVWVRDLRTDGVLTDCSRVLLFSLDITVPSALYVPQLDQNRPSGGRPVCGRIRRRTLDFQAKWWALSRFGQAAR